jgi:hypothetical protein
VIERKNKLQNVQQIPKLERKDGFIRYNSKKLTTIYFIQQNVICEKWKLEIIQTSKKLAKLLLLFNVKPLCFMNQLFVKRGWNTLIKNKLYGSCWPMHTDVRSVGQEIYTCILILYFTSKKYNKMKKKGEHATQMPFVILNTTKFQNVWPSPRQTKVIEGKPKHDGGKDRRTRVNIMQNW